MKKLLLMAAAAMMAAMSAMAQSSNGYTEVGTSSDLTAAVADGALIRLTNDITLPAYLSIGNGTNQTVTIDLNGHALKRNLSAANADGHVIEVYSRGILTVTDSHGGGTISGGRANNGGGICNYGTLYFQGGTITSCLAAQQGGGIKNNANATVYMSGGAVSGCMAHEGAGICNDGGTAFITGGSINGNTANTSITLVGITPTYLYGMGSGIWNSGTMTLGHAIISGNRAEYKGGGIYCADGGNIIIGEGTAITNNAAPDAGGIYVDGSATVSLTGAIITGNKSEEHGGGGITNYGTLTVNDGTTITGNQCLTNGAGIWSSATLKMQGTVTVQDNKRIGSSDITTNVYLRNNCVIHVVGNLNASRIGVTKESITGTVTSNLGAYGNVGHFATDYISETRITLADGEVALATWSGADAWTDDGNYSASFSHVEPVPGNNYLQRVYIESEEELALLAHKINAGESIGYSSIHLNRDLNMDKHLWTPMGTHEHPAEVTFYGHGHTIKGIHVERPSDDYNGLFGYMAVGEIYDLVLTHSYVRGANYTGSVLGGFNTRYYNYELNHVVSDAMVYGADYVGGIAGDTENMRVNNCLYLGSNVSGSNHVGAIFGSNLNNRLTNNNYYTHWGPWVSDADVRAYPVVVGTLPYGVTIGSLSADRGVTHGGTSYVPEGATLTVKAQYDRDMSKMVSGISLNGTAMTDNGDGSWSGTASTGGTATQFTITVTLTDTGIEGDGTEASPYLIATQGQWNTIGTAVMKGNTFSGKHLQLAADIQVSSQIGTQSYPFRGTFDGAGHQLTVKYTASTSEYCAPFQYVDGATVKNLRLTGMVYCNSYAASIIGHSVGNTVMQACRSNIMIQDLLSNQNSTSRIAGLVGLVESGRLTVEGCLFNGSLIGFNFGTPGNMPSIGKNIHTTIVCGFVALARENVAVTVANSFLACSQVSGKGQYTFVDGYYYKASVTISNSYYTSNIGTVQGQQGYKHTLPPADLGTKQTTYNVSGITAYTNGLGFEGNFYNGNADNWMQLTDLADNSNLLALADGKTGNVRINRTLSATAGADDSWTSRAYTVCLPFDLDIYKQTGNNEDVQYYQLYAVSTDRELIFHEARFEDVDDISEAPSILYAGRPYVVVVHRGELRLEANGVTISNTPVDVPVVQVLPEGEVYDVGENPTVTALWRGTFQNISNDDAAAMMAHTMSKDGKFRSISNAPGYQGAYIGTFRAFFAPYESDGFYAYTPKYVIHTEGEDDDEFGIHDFPSDDFEGDNDYTDETTGIGTIHTIDSDGTHRYYDLQGRPLNQRPTRGLYIENGKIQFNK